MHRRLIIKKTWLSVFSYAQSRISLVFCCSLGFLVPWFSSLTAESDLADFLCCVWRRRRPSFLKHIYYNVKRLKYSVSPFLPSLWQNRADIGLADGIFLSVTDSLIPPTSLRLHLVGLCPSALAEWGLAEPFLGRGAEAGSLLALHSCRLSTDRQRKANLPSCYIHIGREPQGGIGFWHRYISQSHWYVWMSSLLCTRYE